MKAEYDHAQRELPRRLQTGDLDAARETRKLGERLLIAHHIAYAKAAKAKALEDQDFAATNRLLSLAGAAKALEEDLKAEDDEDASISCGDRAMVPEFGEQDQYLLKASRGYPVVAVPFRVRPRALRGALSAQEPLQHGQPDAPTRPRGV